MLVMQHLAKRYGERWVVEEVSFGVARGQVVGILGPNGAGKTTSFYMVVGLVKADRGQVLLDGHDISDLPMHARAMHGIGYLPQESSIFAHLSVYDNLLAVAQLHHQNAHAAASAMMEEFSLGHVKKTLGRGLSGGERRRCEIARALLANPSFILLDEPFAGVDPISVGDIRTQALALAARGIGVLITDHNVKETLSICHHAYIISQGRVIADGTPSQIIQNELVKQVYLGDDFLL